VGSFLYYGAKVGHDHSDPLVAAAAKNDSLYPVRIAFDQRLSTDSTDRRPLTPPIIVSWHDHLANARKHETLLSGEWGSALRKALYDLHFLCQGTLGKDRVTFGQMARLGF
jgi:hypothetical protein